MKITSNNEKKELTTKKLEKSKAKIKIFNPKEFSGKLKFKEDPLALQMEWRND